MVKLDFPERWPGLLGQLDARLKGSTLQAVKTALFGLLAVLKYYEYQTDEDRTPLNWLASTYLPGLHSLCTGLMQNYVPANAELLYLALKIFWRVFHNELPDYFYTAGVIQPWLEVFKALARAPAPPEEALSGGKELKSHFWKCKKWAMKISYRFFQRYCNPDLVAKHRRGEAQQWR
jgi:hypothetical protein